MHRQTGKAVWYQTFALVVGAAELILLLCVFLSPDTLGQHRMVSTNLFKVIYFKVGTTLLVLLQLLVIVLYLWQFWRADAVQTGATCLFVCCALLGWVLTVSCDPDTDSTNHVIGAGLFVGGTSVYYVEVLRLTYHYDPISSHRYDLVAAGVLGGAGVFACVYIALWFSSPGSAWIWENIAFVVMAAGYLVFFWFHPFDPSESKIRQPSVLTSPLIHVHYYPYMLQTT